MAARLSEIRPASRAAAGSRRARHQSVDPHPARFRPDLYQSEGELEVRDPAATAIRQPAVCICRAARCWAAPARSTAWSICAAIPPTTTSGASAAAKAGTGIPCCRSSARPRTRSAARTSSTASAGRCTSPTSPAKFELAEAVLEACEQAGIPRNPDFNGARQEGCGYYQTTTSNRRRWSTAKAYLEPARGRPNLESSAPAPMPPKVLIENDRADRRRISHRSGPAHRARPARGDCLRRRLWLAATAAAVGPGPGEHLQDDGRPVVRDMPAVGAHLHDHFNTYLSWRCAKAITLNDLENSWPKKISAAIRYALFRSGPMASNGIHAGLFTRSDPRLERPDLQVNIAGMEHAGTHQGPGEAASVPGLHPDARASAAGRARHGAIEDPRSAGAARRAVRLSAHGLRYERDPGGDPADPENRRAAGVEAVYRRGTGAGPGVDERCGPGGVRASDRRVEPSSEQFLRDGHGAEFRGRSSAAGARGGGVAGRGCLDHAGGGGGQYQRAEHHDRGKGGGDDPGGSTIAWRCRTATATTTPTPSNTASAA